MRYLLLILIMSCAAAEDVAFEEFQTWHKGVLRGYLHDDGSLWIDKEGKVRVVLAYADIRSRRIVEEPAPVVIAAPSASAAKPVRAPQQNGIHGAADEARRAMDRYEEGVRALAATRDEALRIIAANALAVAPAIPVPDVGNDARPSEMEKAGAAKRYGYAIKGIRRMLDSPKASYDGAALAERIYELAKNAKQLGR
jgi:hypothetical protein